MNLPAPLALIELHVYSCCKTNCCSNRCKCRKNTFICTDMHKRVGCENEDGDQSDEKIYLSDDDENINADDFWRSFNYFNGTFAGTKFRGN